MSNPDEGLGADLLSDVLVGLQLRTSALATFYLKDPWGLRVPSFGPAFIYAVMEGSALVEVEGEEALRIEAGDILLMARGDGCNLSSQPGVRLASPDEVFDAGSRVWSPGARLTAPIFAHSGGDGAATQILAVLLDFDERDQYALGLNLPRMIHLRREENRITPWLVPAVNAVVEEAKLGRFGYFAMATRLAELIFINTIRTHLILRPEHASGWLRGLADPRIGRALGAVHRDPAENWTVATLARESGMSRSAFADRFQRLVGETPFEYVTRWRMRLAREWIATGRRSVKEAAHALGYASDKAFSQAFRRTMGCPPSHHRPGRRSPPGP